MDERFVSHCKTEQVMLCKQEHLVELINRWFKTSKHQREWNIVADVGHENYQEIFMMEVSKRQEPECDITKRFRDYQDSLITIIESGVWTSRSSLSIMLTVLCERGIIRAGKYLFW